MKSIKTKIILAVSLLIFISLSIVGCIVSYLMYSSSISTLEKTMSEFAETSANYVNSSISYYKGILGEISLLTRLTSSDYTNEQKGAILADKAKHYNFDNAGYITLDGMLYPYNSNVSDKEYFKAAKNGNFYITEPFMSDVLNHMVIAMAAPVYKNNAVDAVVIMTVNANFLSGITNEINIGDSGQASIVDRNGYTISHSNEQFVKDRLNIIESAKKDPSLTGLAAIQQKMVRGETGFGSYKFNGVNRVMAYAPIPNSNGWSIGILATETEFLQNTFNAIYVTIGLVILFLIAGAIVAFTLSRSIVNPINEIKEVAGQISNGNLNVNIRVKGKDEVSLLANSFVKLRDTILKLMDEISILTSELDNGDIEARIDEKKFSGEYAKVASSINDAIGSLIGDTLLMLGAFTELGDGNFNAELKKFPGKKALANQKYDQLKKNLSSLTKDVTGLISSAIDGKLDVSVDTENYHGDWETLTIGLNNLLNAVNVPINEANDVLTNLSNGNFDVKVSTNYKGSFALMMKSFEKMIDSTSSYIKEISEILDTMSGGDLRNTISREYVGQYDRIKKAINNISMTLRGTIQDIKSSADSVLEGAKQISDSSMDLATGASMQASSIEELNASIITINEQSNQTAEKAQTANEFSGKSIASAKSGNEEMGHMLKSMDEIKEASNNISKIIKVIDDIAFQTNLLALNAAVEAARAGEHGKGFSVVAEEVRSLAGRSSQAAKDTSQLIEDTITKINGGISTAKLTAESLQRIVEDTNSVSEIISSIYSSTKEQSDSISQVTNGVSQIADIVQRNSATSEESAAAAEELNSQSEVLNRMVSNFKI